MINRNNVKEWLEEWISINNPFGKERVVRYNYIAYLTSLNQGYFHDNLIPRVEYDFNPFSGNLSESQNSELKDITEKLLEFQSKGFDLYSEVYLVLKKYIIDFSNTQSAWRDI